MKELLAAREQAGKQYQLAVDTLYAAYIRLASIDAALASPSVYDRAPDVRTFFPLVDNLGQLAHPVFAPLELPGDWRDAVAAARDKLVSEFDNRVAVMRELSQTGKLGVA